MTGQELNQEVAIAPHNHLIGLRSIEPRAVRIRSIPQPFNTKIGTSMTRSALIAKLITPIAAGLFATAAFAHPALVSSTPADKSEVDAPATIELKFTETLVPQFSAANLVMTGMPGMPNHGNMKINASVAAAGDGKTMVITPAQPLRAGDYRVEWRAVSSDTHPITGNVSFKVK